MPARHERDARGRAVRFTGEQEDGDVSGLYYLRARYYDPALGRFWTQDPWGGSAASPRTLNPYPYVMNDPVNLTDPSGLHCRVWHVRHCSASDIVGAISTGVQAADLLPVWGAIPVVNIVLIPVSIPLDLGALGFSLYDIASSDCGVKQKFGLGFVSLGNTVIGIGGQVASAFSVPSVIGPPIIAGLTSTVETTLYLSVREAIERCGEDGKE